MSGTQAKEIGMVTEVHEGVPQVEKAASTMADTFASFSPIAVRVAVMNGDDRVVIDDDSDDSDDQRIDSNVGEEFTQEHGGWRQSSYHHITIDCRNDRYWKIPNTQESSIELPHDFAVNQATKNQQLSMESVTSC